jgi:hypothetical protein
MVTLWDKNMTWGDALKFGLGSVFKIKTISDHFFIIFWPQKSDLDALRKIFYEKNKLSDFHNRFNKVTQNIERHFILFFNFSI